MSLVTWRLYGRWNKCPSCPPRIHFVFAVISVPSGGALVGVSMALPCLAGVGNDRLTRSIDRLPRATLCPSHANRGWALMRRLGNEHIVECEKENELIQHPMAQFAWSMDVNGPAGRKAREEAITVALCRMSAPQNFSSCDIAQFLKEFHSQ